MRELRLARGLRQEDMCRFVLEYGQKNLSLTTLNKLAKDFRIPVSKILEAE